MSAAAGGAVGEAHRVGGDVADTMSLLSRSNSMDSTEGSRRRSLRKREGKSYAEFGDADFIIDEDGSVPGSPVKAVATSLGNNAVSSNCSATLPISNGDVEMESEDDEDDNTPLEPLPLPKELPPDVLEERKALIRKLQTQLRNEEMSLVLLKKIRQSQVLAEQAKEAAAKVSIQPASSSRQSQSLHRGTPPGVGGVQGKSRHDHRGSITTSGGRSGGHKSVLTPDLSHLQPVSVDPKNLPPGLPANLVSLMSKGALGATKLTEVSKTPKMDTETPAQKQAAAKLQLRKQLEKTLLQIPPPKPPPPEMHFIPNPANTEFICLLGLEECVSKILNEDKENSIQPVPFSCSQCGTDFTPTWKWDKGARGKEVKVICENCVTTNVKKALKAEHTNRLKAAFVKALQQEQELEASMAAGGSTSSARISSPSASRNSVDVTVRASSSSRSIPSAHQQSRTTSAATVERATSSYRSSGSNLASSRSTAAQLTRTNSSSSRTNSYNGGTAAASSSRASNKTSSDSLANANAMAAQVAALMGMGAYGSDPTAATSMALLQAAAAQQFMGYGSSTSNSSRANNGSSSSGQRSSSSSNDINSQFAAMNQLMNPLMYNYQAMAAMAQAMAAMSGSGGSSSSSSAKNSSSGSSSSATNQMLEIQRQAAEQLQRQYLLDMIPPGSLSGSWSGSGGKK